MSTISSDATEEALIHEEMNRLRGRLCGLVESWGLPERQERGCISTLKSLSYESEEVFIDLLVEAPRQTQVARH